MEQTLIIIKPDAVQRGIVGRIIQRFEDVGLKITATKMVWLDNELASRHYADMIKKYGKEIYTAQVEFMTEGPVVAMVVEGVEAVDIARKMVGTTYPNESPPGSIRGDFSHHSKQWVNQKGRTIRNLVHASSTAADAKKEIALWFTKRELHSYRTVHEHHTF